MGKKLVAARDLPAGHVLDDGDVALKSPGDGLPPYELERVLGATLRQPVREDDGAHLRAARGAVLPVAERASRARVDAT